MYIKIYWDSDQSLLPKRWLLLEKRHFTQQTPYLKTDRVKWLHEDSIKVIEQKGD